MLITFSGATVCCIRSLIASSSAPLLKHNTVRLSYGISIICAHRTGLTQTKFAVKFPEALNIIRRWSTRSYKRTEVCQFPFEIFDLRHGRKWYDNQTRLQFVGEAQGSYENAEVRSVIFEILTCTIDRRHASTRTLLRWWSNRGLRDYWCMSASFLFFWLASPTQARGADGSLKVRWFDSCAATSRPTEPIVAKKLAVWKSQRSNPKPAAKGQWLRSRDMRYGWG